MAICVHVVFWICVLVWLGDWQIEKKLKSDQVPRKDRLVALPSHGLHEKEVLYKLKQMHAKEPRWQGLH